MSHKNWCDWPSGPCDCGYDKKQAGHKSYCDRLPGPDGSCECGEGLSLRDQDQKRRPK